MAIASHYRGHGQANANELSRNTSRRRRRGRMDRCCGHVGAQDIASIENDPDRILYCCERGSHFVLAYRLCESKKADRQRRRAARGNDSRRIEFFLRLSMLEK